jgi:gliding motility-associated-like protein
MKTILLMLVFSASSSITAIAQRVVDLTATTVFLKESFTPNDDNKNDTWSAVYNGNVDSIRVTIYSRWGSVVFTSTDVLFEWTGKDKKGKTLATGSYIYSFTYWRQGVKTDLKGSILLIV